MGYSSSPVREHAIVIRSIRSGETSRILTLFGKERGKFSVIAKGARRGKAGSIGGSIEPMSIIEAMVYFKASRSVQTLGQTAVIQSFDKVKSDLALGAYGSVIIELLNRTFTDGEVNVPAFRATYSALQALENKDKEPRLILWEFELSLFEAIGFAINLYDCPVCGKNPAEIGKLNYFSIDDGAICCVTCKPSSEDYVMLSGEAIAILRVLSKGDGKLTSHLTPSLSVRGELTRALEKYLRCHHQLLGDLPAAQMLDKLESAK